MNRQNRVMSQLKDIGYGAVVFVATLFLASMVSVASAADEDLEDLKRKISDQEASMKALRIKVQQLQSAQAEQQAESAGGPPGSLKIPGTNTSIKFGGWVKGTLIHDTQARSDDFVSFNAIPLDDEPDAEREGHTRFHARESRFNVMTLTPFGKGQKVKTFLEMDFFGGGGGPGEFADAEQRVSNSFSPRLRQAFGELSFGANSVLIGQTWTNFMSPKLITDRVDFSSPPGSHFVRQAQLRYTRDLGRGNTLSVAIENPESELNGDNIIVGPPRNPNQESDEFPDFTARWQTSGKWGLAYLSGVLRQHRIDDGQGFEADATGWGIGTGLRANVFGRDTLKLQLAGGEGIGRYIKELDGQGATFNAVQNDLEATPAYGGVVGYTRKWSERWRSNLIYGHVEIDNEDIASVDGANKKLQSVHINTFFSPYKNVDLGLEYVYARREIESGREGKLGRITFGGKFRF